MREIPNPQSSKTWDLILDGPLDGAINMAVDSELLDQVEQSTDPKTIVRFYQWRTPTVSLGRNQKVESAVDREYCLGEGIEIVHRPTGGRAVLHDDELTYAVASNDASHFGSTIYGNYKHVSEALCDAVNRIGIPAVLAPETRKFGYTANDEENDADLPCFLSTSRYELTVTGRKIAGSAQRRLRRSFLQHGSIPIACDRERLSRATRLADSAPLYREMAGLGEFLPQPPSVAQLTAALVQSFQERFGVVFRLRACHPRVEFD